MNRRITPLAFLAATAIMLGLAAGSTQAQSAINGDTKTSWLRAYVIEKATGTVVHKSDPKLPIGNKEYQDIKKGFLNDLGARFPSDYYLVEVREEPFTGPETPEQVPANTGQGGYLYLPKPKPTVVPTPAPTPQWTPAVKPTPPAPYNVPGNIQLPPLAPDKSTPPSSGAFKPGPSSVPGSMPAPAYASLPTSSGSLPATGNPGAKIGFDDTMLKAAKAAPKGVSMGLLINQGTCQQANVSPTLLNALRKDN